jgi:hypothetical protein
MERIHVVGLGPRTGTTLMAEAMIAGFRIDAFDAHEAAVSRLRRNAKVYLSKWPGNLSVAGPRLALDRHFHVICMLRDPRDMIASRHAADPERYWISLRTWKQRLAVARRLMRNERFILVRYEDLVAEPDATQAEIARRLPFLQATDTFSRFHLRADPSAPARTALGGLRAIEPRRIGNWRAHLPRLAGQLARHGAITRELIELGYEKDDAWLSALDGVEPDMSPSHFGETADWYSRMRRARSGLRAGLSLVTLFLNRLAGRQIG